MIEVQYFGAAPAQHVRLAISGAGLLGLSLPCTVAPGGTLRIAVRGANTDDVTAAHDAMLVLRWFEDDGTELLWPITVE